MTELEFDDRGLLPAVVQDVDSGTVLMVGYVNAESLEKTLESGEMHFWSRSRESLWRKGETSGNILRVREVLVDCDRDCLLVRAEPAGPTCHTGERSCFFQPLDGAPAEGGAAALGDVLGRLARVVRARHEERPEGSYTTRLFDSGIDRIAQKVGEESTEAVIASVTGDPGALAEESADLLYHLLVLWQAAGLSPGAVAEVLDRRRGTPKP